MISLLVISLLPCRRITGLARCPAATAGRRPRPLRSLMGGQDRAGRKFSGINTTSSSVPVRADPLFGGRHSGICRQRRRKQVVGGPVEVVPAAVVAAGGAGVGVAEGVLDVLQGGTEAE
jgi:hypothetical protein